MERWNKLDSLNIKILESAKNEFVYHDVKRYLKTPVKIALLDSKLELKGEMGVN